MDLFENEQSIYDNAQDHLNAVESGAAFDFNEFVTITKAYGKLLKHLRRFTKTSDETAAYLHKKALDLTDKVHFDALTEIYNRRYMEDNLQRIIRSMSRYNGMLTIMILDIDFFKKYNDTYGHNQGDICLKEIAQAIKGCMRREGDFAARYGGEEFVIVLPNTDEAGAHIIAKRILKSITNLSIPHKENEVADCVTASIGVLTTAVKHFHNVADYIKRADEALYASKQGGRNRYTFAEYQEECE